MTEQQPELIPQVNSQLSPEEQAKREEYRRRLAEYLKDPAFRAIEGFPIGTDEDILALSDPPYYTACPNPFLPEILSQWQQEREEIRQQLGLSGEVYQREPFAADVSEGKNDPIYNAHSYHTKVPHKAIMRYILHYTDPGDIVFDGFCGTGMTGVAAQLCGDKKAVESLGYRVDADSIVWEGNKAISRLGVRKAVLNDLSPAATFIAYNYNTPVDAAAFEREAKRILAEVEKECGWMYETWHPDCNAPNRVKGKINYTVWSDVFVCPTCGQEMVFWEVAVDYKSGAIREKWNCPNCATLLAKSAKKDSKAICVDRKWEMRFDHELKLTIRQSIQKPVLINYSVGKKRFEKLPDENDMETNKKIETVEIPYSVPIQPMMFKGREWGDTWRAGIHAGITNVHHFYTRRSLWVLGCYYSKVNSQSHRLKMALDFLHGSVLPKTTKMNRYMPQHGSRALVGPMANTLYIPSMWVENNIIDQYLFQYKKIKQAIPRSSSSILFTCASQVNSVPLNSVDYIFTDPPFGANIYYAELNSIREFWLKCSTNINQEAVESKFQKKDLIEYQNLMTLCFKRFYDALKSGKWITIEFHNSRNSVWNTIQEGLQSVGFIIADVRILNKKRGGLMAMIGPTATKEDLVISAYKPNGNLEKNFRLKAGTEDGAWEFVRYHLGKLPIINEANDTAMINAERQAFLLFDRMVAFHVQRGVMVPLSAPEFYAGLEQRFTRRDGMYFLPDQVAEYDRAVLDSGKPAQLSLYVSDEKTAITWLRQQLDPASGGEPKTQGDLTNDFNRIMNRAKHEQQLELIEILNQNFLQDPDGKWYVPDHNKATDLEKVRLRTLLREFKEYTESAGRLRVFRSEAVRAGFADCFKHQEFETIVTVADRLPEAVLREDPDLLMYYDSALLRKG